MRGSSSLNRNALSLALCAVCCVVASAESVGQAQSEPARPAEETRLNTGVFRAGLKKRGLTELLDRHLKDFPPKSKTEALLLGRDVQLAEFADQSRPRSERYALLAEANRTLEQVIRKNAEDPRRFEWRLTLAHSLLYEEAEPYLTNILYRDGSASDRKKLRSISTRAVATLTALTEQLAEEYATVDGMAIAEFERLEAKGYIDDLDRLAPQADYRLLWALFYNSLARDEQDSIRLEQLHKITTQLEGDPAMLDTPHDTSHVQVQALLLAGMTQRRTYRVFEIQFRPQFHFNIYIHLNQGGITTGNRDLIYFTTIRSNQVLIIRRK